jgi:hypothetical protein
VSFEVRLRWEPDLAEFNLFSTPSKTAVRAFANSLKVNEEPAQVCRIWSTVANAKRRSWGESDDDMSAGALGPKPEISLPASGELVVTAGAVGGQTGESSSAHKVGPDTEHGRGRCQRLEDDTGSYPFKWEVGELGR